MEIEIGPMDVVTGYQGFNDVDDAFRSAALVLGRLREQTPLTSLFSPRDGFTVEQKGVSTQLTTLLGAHRGKELFLSPQYTVGVPLDGLPGLLRFARTHSERALPSMFADLAVAPAFADEVVAWFSAENGVPASAEVPAIAAEILSGEDARDLKGFAELIFSQAM